jgi:UDP-3-O-acyl-N-acetylglucosamine deacetylase
MFRFTIKSEARFAGVGLFTGRASALTIHPARAGGVRFVLGATEIPATIAHVASTPGQTPLPVGVQARNTTLVADGSASVVATVEHVLSVLAGLGITDAACHIEGPEIPMFDGSGERFVEGISACGGLVQVPGTIEPVAVKSVIEVRDAAGAFIRATPRSASGCTCQYTLDYASRARVPKQTASWNGEAPTYQVDVAPARTFCLASEARALREGGLFAHVSPKDMLVLDDVSGTPVDNMLRFADEPARHKLLDLIGDLALVGCPIQADIVAERSGHALAHQMCRAILESVHR